MASTAEVLPQWINWIAENRSSGVSEAEILKILLTNGFYSPGAPAQDSATPQNPAAGGELRLHKMERLMSIYSELWAYHNESRGIDRVSGLPSSEFFRWYYSLNRPVVLTDVARHWPALQRWTPGYLRSRFGGETVEVMLGRNSDADYEINSDQHKTRMRLDQFVDMVERACNSNDFYMVANNRSLEAGSMRLLLNDIQYFEGILDPNATSARLFLWFGPAGTVTPLHYDTMNILLTQVLGRKRVTLIPSFQTHLVYNHIGVYSQVNCEAPDYERFPLFQYVSKIEVELEPGETLFIPVGWWHHVRSLDTSISLSFNNFTVPNTYCWD